MQTQSWDWPSYRTGSLIQALLDNRDQAGERLARCSPARVKFHVCLAIEGVALGEDPAHVRECFGITTAFHAMVALANHPIPMLLGRGVQPDRVERIE